VTNDIKIQEYILYLVHPQWEATAVTEKVTKLIIRKTRKLCYRKDDRAMRAI